MKAIWNGTTIAQSDDTIVVEGNHYFPLSSVRKNVLRTSAKHTTCPWKGKASYYSIEIDGRVNEDAAWSYPDPSAAADNIRGHVAFWGGVEVVS